MFAVFADEVRLRILNAQNIFPQLGARHNSYCPSCSWAHAHTVALSRQLLCCRRGSHAYTAPSLTRLPSSEKISLREIFVYDV